MRGYDMLDYTEGTKKQREISLSHLHVEYSLYYPVLVLSLVLTFFETPLWCSNGDWFTFSNDAKSQCPTPDGSHTYFSKLPYLPKMRWPRSPSSRCSTTPFAEAAVRQEQPRRPSVVRFCGQPGHGRGLRRSLLNHILDINVQPFSSFAHPAVLRRT